MIRSLPGQVEKCGRGSPGRGKSTAKAQRQERPGVGFPLEDVTCYLCVWGCWEVGPERPDLYGVAFCASPIKGL